MITLQDLGIAYRKAKVDLYYSSHASLEAIASYEEKLHSNLSSLLEKINGEDETWVTSSEFIGSWTLATKSIDIAGRTKPKKDSGLIFSSPTEEWKHILKALAEDKNPKKPEAEAEDKKPNKPMAEFRLMAQCSLNFHVLSTLWILEVGKLFDAKLSRCAYGNRLRRTEDGKDINSLSVGSFQPYLKPFRDWRDNGIAAMRTALEVDKKIIALTADVKSFYHELNPGFMLDRAFISDVLKLELNKFQKKLHRLFIRALQAWAEATPLQKGLPVGLPASAIVANIALVELDRCIEEQIAPIYYGRYVDDILLVMENGADFGSMDELWKWLFDRSRNMLVRADEDYISFEPTYFKEGEGKASCVSLMIRTRCSFWRASRVRLWWTQLLTRFMSALANGGLCHDCPGQPRMSARTY